MKIYYHSNFKKKFKKLQSSMQIKCVERLKLFGADQFALELNNHALKGDWLNHRSINVTGDLRAVYRIKDYDVIFVDIDTHSNLYG